MSKKLEKLIDDVDVEDVSCTEQGYHEPDDWSCVIQEQGRRLREKRDAFLEKLGQPHHIEKISEYQYGYWRLEGGIIRLTRWGDNLPWDTFSQLEFPDAEIEIMSRLKQLEPKTGI